MLEQWLDCCLMLFGGVSLVGILLMSGMGIAGWFLLVRHAPCGLGCLVCLLCLGFAFVVCFGLVVWF